MKKEIHRNLQYILKVCDLIFLHVTYVKDKQILLFHFIIE